MDKPATTNSQLKNLLAEHQELMRKITEIRTSWQEVCEPGIGPKCDEMANRVADIRRLLLDHFAVEEDGGYLSNVLDFAPQFAEQAAQLCGQHASLLKTLDDLETRLRKPESGAWDSVSREFETFIHDLHDHEHQENNLVQSAFNQDEAAGD